MDSRSWVCGGCRSFGLALLLADRWDGSSCLRCRLVVKLVKVDSRLGRVFGYSSSTTI